MNSGLFRKILFGLFTFIGIFSAPASLHAQTLFGILRGQITDPSGAVVTDAAVLLTMPSGESLDTTTNKEGFYEFKALAPGKYTVKIVAPGFAVFTKEDVEIAAGQMQRMNVALTIEEQKQKVEVNDSPTNVDVNPENNAGMVVLRGNDLEALSDDPDEASPVASSRPKLRFAKFASTRIRFRRNMTSSAMAALKFSPSRGRTNGIPTFTSAGTLRRSIRAIHSRFPPMACRFPDMIQDRSVETWVVR